jgi:hypothetical protein
MKRIRTAGAVYSLHKDDLDHVGQFTRFKYEAHGGGDNHLATAMDP